MYLKLFALVFVIIFIHILNSKLQYPTYIYQLTLACPQQNVRHYQSCCSFL